VYKPSNMDVEKRVQLFNEIVPIEISDVENSLLQETYTDFGSIVNESIRKCTVSNAEVEDN